MKVRSGSDSGVAIEGQFFPICAVVVQTKPFGEAGAGFHVTCALES